jgi:DNA-binding transcriptional LysR family regulator
MELYQLRGFIAVAAEGHLTRAADKLHVSQPALSAQIKSLEDEWGVALFERLPGGMGLTPAGRRLLGSAQDVLASVHALQSQAKSMQGAVVGHVRFATVADPAFVRLPDILALALDRCPLVEVEVHHEVTGAAFAQIRDGQLDLGLYYGELTHADVGSMPLTEFDFCIAAPAAWGERLKGADIGLIAEQPWILTPPISSHRTLSDRMFGRLGIRPSTVVEADNEGVILSLVVAGLGMALMRRDIATERAQAGEVAIVEGETLPTTLQLLWHRPRGDEPAVATMREIVREVWTRPRARPPAADQGRTAGASTASPAARVAR